MDEAPFQAMREYGLKPSGHPQGVSCDAEGPAMGPIRLLVKKGARFEPRPTEELNRLLTRTFARPVDCAGLSPGLRAVAGALNEGDIARAMIATTQMRLPTLSLDEARRAAALIKAADDDPDHPGWPAGTPGGRGGQFRPKDASEESVKRARKKKTEEELLRHFKRRLIREALRKILTPQRVLRLAGEAAANAIPVLNVAADVAMAADIASMAADFVDLKRDADAALEFVQRGPYELKDLLVDDADRSFSSYAEFKKIDLVKFYGPAGEGYEYHHIVEQSAEGDISARDLNSTRNIIRIPTLLHEEINGEYGRTDENTGISLRRALKGASFEKQLQEGARILLRMGIIE